MEDQPMRRMKTFIQGGGSIHTPRWRFSGRNFVVFLVEFEIRFKVELGVVFGIGLDVVFDF